MSYAYKMKHALYELDWGVWENSHVSELVEFVASIQRTFRCKLGTPEEDRHEYISLIYPYYEDCPVALGYIGYGPMQNTTSDEFYYVNAPTISNGRYADYSFQHNMAMTKSLNKGIANAKRFLRRPQLKDIAAFMWSQYSDLGKPNQAYTASKNFTNERLSPQELVRNAAGKLSNIDEVLMELDHLHRSGYVFQSHILANNVREYVEAKDSRIARDAERPTQVMFIHYKPDGSMDALKFDGGMRYAHEIKNHAEVIPVVPDDVMSRIAALSICEVGSHVELVGTRVTPDCFFVYA